jgi:hypothetical protein
MRGIAQDLYLHSLPGTVAWIRHTVMLISVGTKCELEDASKQYGFTELTYSKLTYNLQAGVQTHIAS